MSSHGNSRTMEQRFWKHVVRDPDTECWEWTAALHWSGYGRIALYRGGNLRAHRIAYELLVGPIPEGLQLDHLCRNRSCVNPAHLEPVTAQENLRRGFGIGTRNAAKTHCPGGHAYDFANTRIERDGSRKCRTCCRERAYRKWLRSKEETAA